MRVKPQRPFTCRSVDLVTNTHAVESGHTDIKIFKDLRGNIPAKFCKSEAAMCLECGWNCCLDLDFWKRAWREKE